MFRCTACAFQFPVCPAQCICGNNIFASAVVGYFAPSGWLCPLCKGAHPPEVLNCPTAEEKKTDDGG